MVFSFTTVEEIFSHIDLIPLGAASIAQCHKGTLKDGTPVAIKIQHPNVKKNAYTDMDIVDVSKTLLLLLLLNCLLLFVIVIMVIVFIVSC